MSAQPRTAVAGREVAEFVAGSMTAGRLPDGQTFHAGGASAGAWTILEVHESKESSEQFRDNILLPPMQQGIEGGFASPPPRDCHRRLQGHLLAIREAAEGSEELPPVRLGSFDAQA
jgi:hypothetical protein